MNRGKTLSTRRRAGGVWPLVAALITLAAGLAVPSPAHAAVTLVEGRAYGSFGTMRFATAPQLWWGPEGFWDCAGPVRRACTASVSLPPNGGVRTATDPGGDGVSIIFGPATLFTSGPQRVRTQATLGAGGSVTSSAYIPDINRSGLEVFTARSAASTCTASEAGVSAATVITGGAVQTSQGDPDVDGDEVYVPVPTNPPPNTTIHGQVEAVGDSFDYIFNEQVLNPDGSITVYAAHLVLLGPVAVGDIYIGKSTCGATHRVAPADFNDDGDTDVSVFRPSDGLWFVEGPTVRYGATGDVPVPGDYDNDGDADVAVYRPSAGVWLIQDGQGAAWGTAGDIPVPADYDGDGDTDIAVFRPSTGVWYVREVATVEWGAAGDIPVPADYDGDGDADIAVFRPSTGEWLVTGGGTAIWGTAGDIPVPGDYNGDGAAEFAVFRPSNGLWFVRGGPTVAWGASGDIPVPGNYDGDADTDIAVFRPSSGTWLINGGPTVAFGTSGDVPLPQPDAIRRFFFTPL